MVNIRGMTEGCIDFYGSEDLLHWGFLSTFRGPYPGRWECPDLFPLTTPSGRELWILKFNAPCNYLVGEFDGEGFSSLAELPCPNTGAIYAEVTFNDVPDGRRLLMGWLRGWACNRSPASSPWVKREMASISSNNLPARFWPCGRMGGRSLERPN
jgi:fructan beta-fructosidase